MSAIKKSEKERSKLWIRYISKFVSIVAVLVVCLTTISATIESNVTANFTHELLLPPGETRISTMGEPKVTATNPCEHGFIDFEEGTDRAVIHSTIHGVKFTTTAGQDWLYGDWRTGEYNGKYPDGAYTSNGNLWAWLGENQGYGRIDFTEGNATYLSLLTSTYSGVTIDAYDSNGTLLANSGWATKNTNTGTMTRLNVSAPGMAYVIIHDTGNYWLIDDICTDAGGVRGVNLDISTDKMVYSFNETVNISAKVTDAYGSCLYPLHKDNFTVYVDGVEVDIEGFKELSCTEYKLVTKAPKIVGDHTIGVNVDTAPGREYDSTGIKVYTIGNVYLTVEGNRLTQYENSADTPIYRRNDDGTVPAFSIEVEIIGVTPSEFSEVEDNIHVFVNVSDYTRVKDPENPEATAFACGPGNSILYNAEWKSPDDSPVGKYNATAEVKDLNDNLLASSEKKHFYLIFKPPSGYEGYISSGTSTYNQFDYQLWKPVLDKLNGYTTLDEAARTLLLFAHGIDDSYYGYWHMLLNEQQSFYDQMNFHDPTHLVGDYVGGNAPYSKDYAACSGLVCPHVLCGFAYGGKNAWWDNMVDFIESDFDPEEKAVNKRPTGVCDDYATLFVSNARSAGIPAKEITEFFYQFAGHEWAVIFDGNKWVHCDPTWYQVDSLYNGIRVLYDTPDVYTNERGYKPLYLDSYKYIVQISVNFDSNDYDYGDWVNADITVKNIGHFDIKRDLYLEAFDTPSLFAPGFTCKVTDPDINIGTLDNGDSKSIPISYKLPDCHPNWLCEGMGDRFLVVKLYYNGNKTGLPPCFSREAANITFSEKKETIPGLCPEWNPQIRVDNSTVELSTLNSTSFCFDESTNESTETFVKPQNVSVTGEHKIKYYSNYTRENWYIFNPNNNTHDYSLLTPLLGVGDAVYIPGYGAITANQSIDVSADYIVIYNTTVGTNGSIGIYAFSKNMTLKNVTLLNGVVKVIGMQNCTLAPESGESYLTYLSTINGSGMSFIGIYDNFAQEIVSNGDTLTQFFIEGEHEQISYYKVGDTVYVNTTISNNGILAETRNLSLTITESLVWIATDSFSLEKAVEGSENDGSENIIYNATETVIIPAKSEADVTFQYQIPDNPQIGEHGINISDDITKATTIIMIQASFNVTFDVPAIITQAEEFYVNATITNALDISLSGINVTIELPNDFNTSEGVTKNIGTLFSGESANVSWLVNATDFEYGYAPITLYINSAEGINDIATTSLTVLRLPELKIFTSAPPEAQINVSFEFRANVTNEGDLNLSGVSVNLSLPDNVTTTDDLTKLIGGLAGEETKSVNWTITSMRENDFWIEVNGCDVNGTYCARATELINIVKPEIELDFVNPVEVILNQSFSAIAKIKNIGELNASQVKVNLSLPPEFETVNDTFVNIGNLSPGQTKEVEWTLKGVNPGYGEITVNVTLSGDVSITKGVIVTYFPLSVETDKNIYMRGDNVNITSNTTNENPEVSYVDLVMNQTIQGPNITETCDRSISYIGSLESQNVTFTWDTTGKPLGNYIVTSRIMGSPRVISEASTSFTIELLETDLPNVELVSADPTVTSINLTSLNLSDINETYKPDGITSQYAYMINSTGAGNFTLRFTNITNANTIIVYKINATDQWIELDATTTANTVTFTMSVEDPPVIFCSRAPPVAAQVPTLTPVGIIALAGLLSVVAVGRIRRKK